MRKVLSIVALTVLFVNCTVQKRVYNRGYNISWNKKFGSQKEQFEQKRQLVISDLASSVSDEKVYYNLISIPSDEVESELNTQISSKQEKVVLNQGNTIKSIVKEKAKSIKKNENECDLIIKKSGEEINAKVLEIGISEIKYKECNNIEGPTFTISKSDVFMIKYPNGTNTVISSSESTKDNNSSESSDKSQLVAFLLCWFLGIIGIHRFYLGHIGVGILYLLTAGLCGIGVLIDLILIATGGLKPKNGNYKN